MACDGAREVGEVGRVVGRPVVLAADGERRQPAGERRLRDRAAHRRIVRMAVAEQPDHLQACAGDRLHLAVDRAEVVVVQGRAGLLDCGPRHVEPDRAYARVVELAVVRGALGDRVARQEVAAGRQEPIGLGGALRGGRVRGRGGREAESERDEEFPAHDRRTPAGHRRLRDSAECSRAAAVGAGAPFGAAPAAARVAPLAAGPAVAAGVGEGERSAAAAADVGVRALVEQRRDRGRAAARAFQRHCHREGRMPRAQQRSNGDGSPPDRGRPRLCGRHPYRPQRHDGGASGQTAWRQ